MDTTIVTDLQIVAREVGIPLDKVQRTVDLLDDGNTVPFITRYRKDETGGLDEEQIRAIQSSTTKLRQLNERKRTILKSIQSQEKLTEELADHIRKAQTQKLLEDLYLPFKPKKQTLATQARERGLEPLALEVLHDAEEAKDLPSRAATFVDAEKSLADVDAVLQGVGYLIAESFSEHAILRGRLRKLFWKTGQLTSTRIENGGQDDSDDDQDHSPEEADVVAEETTTDENAAGEEGTTPESTAEATETEAASADAPATGENASSPAPAKKEGGKKPTIQEIRREKRKRQKEKERAKKDKAFRDYYDYHEPVSKIPPHRVLAINRGDRTRFLKVRIEVDFDKVTKTAEDAVIPEGHTHAAYLKQVLRDSLNRLIIPSIEREIRRELTEKAETHAIEVFACNLRKLLLQPPVRGKRVLAIDPGFRSGCKLVAIDPFGNVMGTGVIHLIGPQDRVEKSRSRIVEMIKQYDVQIVAIGNGTACRETEQIVAGAITNELRDRDLCYLIVNEAGASVYSTSELGREEFPKFDATIRGTISIGRRLLDPLSELVKINPSNIGVGLYQHDVKAKHLRDSLDDVVESCVNYVGVDVNTASPALLSYVSGLNQLTARRIYEHRQAHGPFRSREEIREVAGIGEATFVQAAGFLKVVPTENPLDATWIHPESYDVATQILEKLGCSLTEVLSTVPSPPPIKEKTPASALLEPAPEEIVAEEAPAEPAEAPATDEQPAVAETEVAEAVASSATVATEETPAATEEATEISPEAASEAETTAAEPAAEESPAAAETAEPTAADEETTVEPPAPQPPPVEIAASDEQHKQLVAKITSADVEKLAEELNVGVHLARDILGALSRPGRDPRADFPPPLFRRGVLKLEDLEPGMEMVGTVLNVVDFGAFVDIGLHDSGMVHISRLADRYVGDPHEVVSVGDVIRVWVIEIDRERRRVSLTAIDPAKEVPKQEKPPRHSNRPQRTDRPQRPKQQQKSGHKPHGGHGKGKQGGKPRHGEKRAKPKPMKPITEAMKEGKEPLRSFGDLQQFFQMQKDDKNKPKGK
ncbi:Tex-like N-terminal domain-containing protein [Blastopirellula marina]|uniref:Transcriptional accessory protein Tex n=1 Tax=Blastopirellula marina TaxID=124 RepID=A0A2S8FHP3_9BACT|nr:Tex family protein [Blastopirellula marina]PQO31698.1 transcriptional accessory protein Tex [Blastopirellula marina]PTL43005.1 RNA-binding transcriptional accessory protein [Blastopirellula marina]